MGIYANAALSARELITTGIKSGCSMG